MQLALYQPEIAGNVGAVIRLAACWSTPLHIIEPCGFAAGDKQMKRAALDYGPGAAIHRWADWQAFRAGVAGRLVLMTTKAQTSLHAAKFDAGDVLLFGAETSGVPPLVADAADLALRIPMHHAMRSLNLGMSAAITLAEAMRQTGGFAGEEFQ